MPRLQTMGTSSCATIAIGHMKWPVNGMNAKEANEKYKSGELEFDHPEEGMSVEEFYNKIIYPTDQKLGGTGDYPFERLMEVIDNKKSSHSFYTKFIIVTLNSSQYFEDDKYWPKELERWGFSLIDKTKNTLGSVNYIYTRNNNRVDIGEKDEKGVFDE